MAELPMVGSVGPGGSAWGTGGRLARRVQQGDRGWGQRCAQSDEVCVGAWRD